MNGWTDLRTEYVAWLRSLPLVSQIGRFDDAPEVVTATDSPVFLNNEFWSARTHETEIAVQRYLSEKQIDNIFDEVAAVIDEDLQRFDSLVKYYGRFAPDGDGDRIEWEREAAHSIKRDLAWAACERAIGKPGFFCALLKWYERGRWPFGWLGIYPFGHVQVI